MKSRHNSDPLKYERSSSINIPFYWKSLLLNSIILCLSMKQKMIYLHRQKSYAGGKAGV